MHIEKDYRKLYRKYKNKYLNLKSQIKIDNADTHREFWVGPFGVLVPNNIKWVVASDGFNKLNIKGFQTEMGMPNAPYIDETIYRQKYATYNPTNGYWYYNVPIN